jgi:hypothetical protein
MKGFSLRSLLLFGQCKGITKQGAPCQAREVWSNGLCKHHGGAGESPFEIRKRHLIEKAERQHRRLMRKLGLDKAR